MTNMTVIAAALAVGLGSFASVSIAEASGNGAATPQDATTQEIGLVRFLASVFDGSNDADVDESTTGSIVSEEKSAVLADATTGQARPYSDIISRYAAKHGVPVQLVHAVVRVESNYRANARGAAGEVGLMQIKPATARGMGYSGSVEALYNPETNIRFGVKYLARAHQLGGGDTCGTILRYNAGHGATRMNRISANYCQKVQRIMAGA